MKFTLTVDPVENTTRIVRKFAALRIFWDDRNRYDAWRSIIADIERVTRSVKNTTIQIQAVLDVDTRGLLNIGNTSLSLKLRYYARNGEYLIQEPNLRWDAVTMSSVVSVSDAEKISEEYDIPVDVAQAILDVYGDKTP